MRAMIIGDVASGKSTFAVELGAILEVPVVHLDQVMQEVGRQNDQEVALRIREEAAKDAWVIDGNAFNEDSSYRLERADKIFAFNLNPLISLGSHIARYSRIHQGKESAIGGIDEELRLPYYISYCLFRQPRLKRQVLEAASLQAKGVTVFERKKEATNYLAYLSLQKSRGLNMPGINY